MRRAVGIIRVSETGDREGDSFISPAAQQSRIEETGERFSLELIGIKPEINVSGGTPLSKREGLLWGVEAIETGEAAVLIVGYFDRLVRDLKIQWEIVSRVEAAGGEVLAVDFGRISEETAAQWLSATMVGAVHEYVRRQGREKTADAQADAIARGIPPFPHIPPGYRREIIGTNRRGLLIRGPFIPEPDAAALMVQAFQMRDEGKSFNEIRLFLLDHGIARSHHAVSLLLSNRVYLGELHFGKLENLRAHKPIIRQDLFNRVQRVKGTRGRKGKSDRLLARLGVLRCHEGARMVASVKVRGKKRYPYYRCPPYRDCKQPMAIAAELAEAVVVDEVRLFLSDIEEQESTAQGARDAAASAEKAQADLDAAIRAFAGLEDEAAAIERIAQLRGARDGAVERAKQLGSLSSVRTISVNDWDRFTTDEKRGLIRDVVRQATVAPGRGRSRVTVEFFSE